MLAPLAGLSQERLAELAQVAVVERAARGSDPLKERINAPQSVFLLQGELLRRGERHQNSSTRLFCSMRGCRLPAHSSISSIVGSISPGFRCVM
jgi:hypothetical protein